MNAVRHLSVGNPRNRSGGERTARREGHSRIRGKLRAALGADLKIERALGAACGALLRHVDGCWPEAHSDELLKLFSTNPIGSI